jgi:hypothetical protein
MSARAALYPASYAKTHESQRPSLPKVMQQFFFKKTDRIVVQDAQRGKEAYSIASCAQRSL